MIYFYQLKYIVISSYICLRYKVVSCYICTMIRMYHDMFVSCKVNFKHHILNAFICIELYLHHMLKFLSIELADPCGTNPQQCNNHGNCLQTSIAPYFLCSCIAGYSGDTCLTGNLIIS